MLSQGTKLKKNEVVHLADGTTEITALHKGQPMIILVDTDDWPLVEPYFWYVEHAKKTYYAATETGACRDGVRHRGRRMHAILCPNAPQVDHINRNGLDNRRKNLRPVTNQQNSMNRSKLGSTSSSFIGVSWETDRHLWVAGYKKDGKRVSLGRYADPVEAAIVRDAKVAIIFGDFANLNFNITKNFGEAYNDTKRWWGT